MQAQLNHSGLRYLGEYRPVYLLKEKEKQKGEAEVKGTCMYT